MNLLGCKTTFYKGLGNRDRSTHTMSVFAYPYSWYHRYLSHLQALILSRRLSMHQRLSPQLTEDFRPRLHTLACPSLLGLIAKKLWAAMEWLSRRETPILSTRMNDVI